MSTPTLNSLTSMTHNELDLFFHLDELCDTSHMNLETISNGSAVENANPQDQLEALCSVALSVSPTHDNARQVDDPLLASTELTAHSSPSPPPPPDRSCSHGLNMITPFDAMELTNATDTSHLTCLGSMQMPANPSSVNYFITIAPEAIGLLGPSIPTLLKLPGHHDTPQTVGGLECKLPSRKKALGISPIFIAISFEPTLFHQEGTKSAKHTESCSVNGGNQSSSLTMTAVLTTFTDANLDHIVRSQRQQDRVMANGTLDNSSDEDSLVLLSTRLDAPKASADGQGIRDPMTMKKQLSQHDEAIELCEKAEDKAAHVNSANIGSSLQYLPTEVGMTASTSCEQLRATPDQEQFFSQKNTSPSRRPSAILEYPVPVGTTVENPLLIEDDGEVPNHGNIFEDDNPRRSPARSRKRRIVSNEVVMWSDRKFEDGCATTADSLFALAISTWIAVRDYPPLKDLPIIKRFDKKIQEVQKIADQYGMVHFYDIVALADQYKLTSKEAMTMLVFDDDKKMVSKLREIFSGLLASVQMAEVIADHPMHDDDGDVNYKPSGSKRKDENNGSESKRKVARRQPTKKQKMS